MAERLDGRVALVSGASSGIGAATARALAEQGAAVALGARRTDRLEELAAEIRTSGGTALPIELDVSDIESCRQAVARTRSELGGLDILVNNAGIGTLGPVLGADPEDWRKTIEINLLGVMFLTSAAIDGLVEQGHGHVLTISSVGGRVAHAGNAVYGATKFGVNAFCEGLRQEVTSRGVRITMIEPGLVATEITSTIPDEEHRRSMEQRLEESDPLQPEDIADAVTWAATRPARVSVNEVLVRPTEQER
jgi:NADP-dependent 3-hydroxy acid dehydrogenase YdfG